MSVYVYMYILCPWTRKELCTRSDISKLTANSILVKAEILNIL